MSQADEALAAEVTALFAEMVLSNAATFGSAALLLYDYFLTLPQEAHCIWGRKLSAPTVLFYVNRYGILISRVFLIGQSITWQGAVAGPETQAICSGFEHLGQTLTLILSLDVSLLQSLRTYAIWNCNRWIFVLMISLGLVQPINNIVYYTRVVPYVLPVPFSPCDTLVSISVRAGLILGLTNCISAMFAAAVMFLLTWLKTAEVRKDLPKHTVKSSLAGYLLRDGILYFLIILILNILNMLSVIYQIFGIFPAFTQALQSIVVSRFIMNLRLVGSPIDDHEKSQRASSVYFAPDIVDNMGAPLDCPSLEPIQEDELDAEDAHVRGVDAIFEEMDDLESPRSSIFKMQIEDV